MSASDFGFLTMVLQGVQNKMRTFAALLKN